MAQKKKSGSVKKTNTSKKSNGRKSKSASFKTARPQVSAANVLIVAFGFIFMFSTACFIFIPDESYNEIHKIIRNLSSDDNTSKTVDFTTTTTVDVPVKSTKKTTATTTSKKLTTAKTIIDKKASTTTKTTGKTGKPENIIVFLKSQKVFVYDKSDNVVKSFICSSGKASTPTRTGTYAIHHKYRWRLMKGDCYAQYASAFSGEYLFHSVPYNKRDASTMMNGAYDRLGSPASSGCIRLCFRDTKWIYDNCPIGTSVLVVNKSAPKGISPEAIVSRKKDAKYNGWDPTDTSLNNPYNK